MGIKSRIRLIEKNISVTDLLAKMGIEMNPGDRTMCPIHEGSNQSSFHVKSDDRRWKCYSCNRYGGVIKLAEHFYKLSSFIDALNKLEEDLGLTLDKSAQGIISNLNIASAEDDSDNINVQSMFESTRDEIEKILVASRPEGESRKALWEYYLMLISCVDEIVLDLAALKGVIPGDTFYVKCVEHLSYVRKFIPFYWRCTKQHLIISKRIGKDIRKMSKEELQFAESRIDQWLAKESIAKN